MRNVKSLTRRGILAATILIGGTVHNGALAQDSIDPDAASVLVAMSGYLEQLQSFTVRFDVGVETVSYEFEKLEFNSSGDVAIQRPNKAHVTRRGAVADVEIVLDGTNLNIVGRNLNGYFQLPAASIDEAVLALRESTGLDAPAADFLVSVPFETTVTDMLSGTHVGMTYIGGVLAHHLSFRGRDVDWQLWVQDGDEPLPLKYVITSKWVVGSPQYTLLMTDWDTSPTLDETMFNFTPPAEAQELTGMLADETGNLAGLEE